MKRIALIVVALAMISTASNAQKTVIKTESFSDTQARMLEVTAKSYVRPLVVDLVVKKGQTRMLYTNTYTRDEVEVAMGGSLDNLRSRVIYEATADTAWNCDAVVAPTFMIKLSKDQTLYEVEMKGFPANFDTDSWHPLGKNPGKPQDAEEDYRWLELDKRASYDKAQDPDRAGAVIRNIMK